jgi:hypothetical protein
MVRLTERAAAVVAQAETAARRFNPAASIRLVGDGAAVRFELADGPAPGDERVPAGEATLLVPSDLHGVVDVGEHNVPVLTPE